MHRLLYAGIYAVLIITLGLPSCSSSDSDKEKNVDTGIRTSDDPNLKNPDDMSEYRADLFRHYHDVFNDSNKFQYAHARRLGIDPITSLKAAYFTRRPIVKIEDCEYYIVDSLSHSVPYLVPEAAALLNEIGKNFRDSLISRKMPCYRLKITSLLRTPSSVKSLRRVNRNATDSSAHQYATTFDIAYNGFSSVSRRDNLSVRGMKEVLAEVLYDLRAQNRCMVKHERKSPCFHVTVMQEVKK